MPQFEVKKAKKKSLFVIEQALVKYPILSGFKPFLALTKISLNIPSKPFPCLASSLTSILRM